MNTENYTPLYIECLTYHLLYNALLDSVEANRPHALPAIITWGTQRKVELLERVNRLQDHNLRTELKTILNDYPKIIDDLTYHDDDPEDESPEQEGWI